MKNCITIYFDTTKNPHIAVTRNQGFEYDDAGLLSQQVDAITLTEALILMIHAGSLEGLKKSDMLSNTVSNLIKGCMDQSFKTKSI